MPLETFSIQMLVIKFKSSGMLSNLLKGEQHFQSQKVGLYLNVGFLFPHFSPKVGKASMADRFYISLRSFSVSQFSCPSFMHFYWLLLSCFPGSQLDARKSLIGLVIAS